MVNGTDSRNTAQGDVAAIIVAAGSSTRMGGGMAKQFLDLAGQPVITHSVKAFLHHGSVGEVIIVCGDGQQNDLRRSLGSVADSSKVRIVPGGDRRQDSVMSGLQAAATSAPRLVAIHDAARPLLPEDVLDRLFAAMEAGSDAALPVMPVVDTLKHVTDTKIDGTIDRARLGAAQTPQVFRFPDILALHQKHDSKTNITDDIQLVEQSGGTVTAVTGDRRLMKLTVAEDLTLLQALAGAPDRSGAMIPDIRVGNGFDVHKFSDGPGPIMLAGVEIPSERGLSAHSDGDVGLHALCDAIFGALGDGDIGSHFPPSEERWKDAKSDQFLTFAMQRCAARGAQIMHLDLTLICETPKIGPHRDAMRARIAEIAAVSIDRVGVKATTSEGLGFTGRGEGIAAQATATITMPSDPSHARMDENA